MSTPLAGVLLTGGASTRMGTPKARLRHQGETLADRAARALSSVCDPVVEVGPGFTRLRSVREEPSGSGPLAALDAGARAVGRWPLLLLAVDLPRADEDVLRLLARHPGRASVVPVLGGQPQPLCARYGAEVGPLVQDLLQAGERSMRALLDAARIELLDEARWAAVVARSSLEDVDTPEDARRVGIEVPAARAGPDTLAP